MAASFKWLAANPFILLFLTVALAATAVPAWRAARVDPLRALTGRLTN